MKSINHILNNLTPSHIQDIRKSLQEESRFNKYSISIFDLYLQGHSESRVIAALNLNDRNFKTFERSIEKMIFQFYNIETQKYEDLIFSSIFYSLHTHSENKNALIAELEELFHNMKQMKIDQAATPILRKLKELSADTPLEPLYTHLYQQYQASENNIIEMLRLLTVIFSKVEKLAYYSNDKALNSYCYAIAEQMEVLRAQEDNHTAQVIYEIARLSLYIFSHKKLNWENYDAMKCLNEVGQLVKKLPLDIYRFYLENIHIQLSFHLCKINDELEKGIYLFDTKDIKKKIEANNLFFPNHMTLELIEEFNKPYAVKYNFQDKGGIIYTLRNN